MTIETRDYAVTLTTREAGDGARIIEGIAVPYGVETRLWGDHYETFAPGSAEVHPGAVAMSRHRDPIGLLTAH